MKHKITLILFLITTLTYSQQVSEIVAELNKNWTSYNANPALTKIYLNRNEKILDILGYQIPLNKVKILYEQENRIFQGVKIEGSVNFECEYSCILNGDEKILAVAFGYKSKDGAYKFIELLYRLIEALEQ